MRPNRRPQVVHVFADGHLILDGRRLHCTLGKGGVRIDKREGDGATPAGVYPVRALRYRRRNGTPVTALPRMPILRTHGWCDDPASPRYNAPVRLPCTDSHERLWREDRLYDAVISIGHNDRPAVSGRGSAVFIHVMSPDGGPTDGCIALRPVDLDWLLVRLRPGDLIRIAPPDRRAPGFPPRRGLRKALPCAAVSA